MERITLDFTARAINIVEPQLIGGSPAVGIRVMVSGADPDAILEQLFEWFGEDELIKFIKG